MTARCPHCGHEINIEDLSRLLEWFHLRLSDLSVGPRRIQKCELCGVKLAGKRRREKHMLEVHGKEQPCHAA